jgi:hypothetical protein
MHTLSTKVNFVRNSTSLPMSETHTNKFHIFRQYTYYLEIRKMKIKEANLFNTVGVVFIKNNG